MMEIATTQLVSMEPALFQDSMMMTITPITLMVLVDLISTAKKVFVATSMIGFVKLSL